jgi:hypothetical protein
MEVGPIVLVHGMKPAGTGLLIGFAPSLAVTQLLKSMLFQVSTFDFVTFDPTTALRTE